MTLRPLFRQNEAPKSPPATNDFPKHPLLLSPVVLLLVATLLILGFLVGLSCQTDSPNAEKNERQHVCKDFGNFDNRMPKYKKSTFDSISIEIGYSPEPSLKIARKSQSNRKRIFDRNLNLDEKFLRNGILKTDSKRTENKIIDRIETKSNSFCL